MSNIQIITAEVLIPPLFKKVKREFKAMRHNARFIPPDIEDFNV